MQKSYIVQLKKFGKEIKRLREEHGLTQQDLSAKCDIDVRTVQRIEKGEYGVGLHILIALAGAFDMQPYELIKPIRLPGKDK